MDVVGHGYNTCLLPISIMRSSPPEVERLDAAAADAWISYVTHIVKTSYSMFDEQRLHLRALLAGAPALLQLHYGLQDREMVYTGPDGDQNRGLTAYNADLRHPPPAQQSVASSCCLCKAKWTGKVQ